ncbi:stage III sporulation protein AA [Pontibacillus sp. HMF3514]|uniref:stage III sporulation protein AA n=1 Tax=Pontibacillus sp. HMF3514 TaxID=2692425 RepID=UPI00131FF0D1|nr:stage III sporulation protein AA [Pontibacillus sp. HMF3514]QHE52921.1 stage III sporulation protein AA [Pontibacillus sp. HMF3514]
MDEILRILPPHIEDEIRKIPDTDLIQLQEIRYRINRPLELIFDHKYECLTHVIPTAQDGQFLLNKLGDHSIYRLEDELREGYITIAGGHRVGLSGKVNTDQGTVKAIRHISSYNIRIAKEKIGVATSLVEQLYQNDDYQNTLIIGPPQTGKTTLLRDMARIMSQGDQNHPSKKVAIIDERSEIAGCIKGVPQHQVGMRTDVMDACPKAEGMMMMIRSMSPEILIVDEIGSEADVKAIMEAVYAGVTIISTVHGDRYEAIKQRPSLAKLFHQKVFKRLVVLERTSTPGAVQSLLDGDGQILQSKKRCVTYEVDRSSSPTLRYNVGRI